MTQTQRALSSFRLSKLLVPADAAETASQSLGDLPEWNLADLYPAPDSEEIKRDLEEGAAEARRLKETYQGKLAEAAKDGAELSTAIKAYEALADRLGRLGSYAGLLYAANQADPERAKFYGDVNEKLTAMWTDLLFLELELNQIDEAVLQAALEHPELSRYKPWFEDLRKEKPYQLSEEVERLFTEKSQTGAGAFNRLFNETMSSLNFEVAGEAEPLGLEATLNLMSEQDGKRRQAGAEALAKVFKDNLRLFTLITNTLAKDKEISDRWRGFKDVADSRHLNNRVEREVVDALVASVREAKKLDLVATLYEPGSRTEEERVGSPEQTREILGVKVPQVCIAVLPGRDLANVIETAALDQKLRRLGHDATKELDDRLIALMTGGQDCSE